MRKLIVSTIISLDGYYEGPGGDVMALPMDHTFDAHNLARMRAASTLLFGRRTYELFSGFWPPVADDPDATPDEREISERNAALEKVVISDTLEAGLGPWADTTRIVPRAGAPAAVAELKADAGQDILVFGSRTVWNDLLAAGLVDELYVVLAAGVLGGGTPAFADGLTAGLRLLGSRTDDGSDNVTLRYVPAA